MSIKEFIFDNVPQNPEEYALYLADCFLEYNNCFADYNLSGLVILDFKKKGDSKPQIQDSELDLVVSLGKEDKIISVRPESSVFILKKKVKEGFKPSFEEFSLIFDSTTMESEKSLSDYKLSSGSNILMVQNQIQGIYVNLEGNQRICIKADLADKILFLKKRIEEQLKISLDDKDLIFKNTNDILQPNNTLKECGIRYQNTILVVDRQIQCL